MFFNVPDLQAQPEKALGKMPSHVKRIRPVKIKWE
jgi:hypothetical protein